MNTMKLIVLVLVAGLVAGGVKAEDLDRADWSLVRCIVILAGEEIKGNVLWDDDMDLYVPKEEIVFSRSDLTSIILCSGYLAGWADGQGVPRQSLLEESLLE